MNSRELFDRLMHAEHEDEVDQVLTVAGYSLENESVWKPLGDIENNFSTVANQQAEATGALVEKIINGIDSLLMAECFRRRINPEGTEAPRTMGEAVQTFLSVKDGRLENLDSKEQTALAQNLQVVATGEKSSPCYLIIDTGEGQTPASFPDTFLSLKRSNKMRIPFVQGKYNSGGTGVLQFCGEKNMQLFVSRRNPVSPVASGDETRDLWGFTIVRRMKPKGGRRSSMYVYLAPAGAVPSFAADSIKVLPEKRSSIAPRAYAEGLSHGTCVKLYNFRWRGKGIATLEARYELERFLHSPCLPFRLTETRAYKANYFSTTISGVWVSVAAADGEPESAKIEPGFGNVYADLTLPSIGHLPYRLVVFKEEVEPRHIPHGVFFNINGQAHGALPSDFVSRQLKFDYLKDHLLVSVDCTAMEDTVREDFFMASRDRVRRNEVYEVIVEKLREELREHPGLRELNNARRKKEIEKATSDEQEAARIFDDLLKTDPSLAALFSLGGRLVTRTGPGSAAPFTGKKFPTFFRLEKNPKEGVSKPCPVNRTCRLNFDTDATNDYFSRSDCPGRITTEPANLIEYSHLWNGEFSARFRAPWNAKPGQRISVKVTVSDVQTDARDTPFVSTFTLIAEEEGDRNSPPGKTRGPQRSPENGKKLSPSLAVPNVREASKSDLPFLALEVKHDDEGRPEFFVNMDNAFLLTELTRCASEDQPLIKFWFKYGLAICAMGMLQQERRKGTKAGNVADKPSAEPNGENEEAKDQLGQISHVCSGLASVIVPIIRTLYRGPQLRD